MIQFLPTTVVSEWLSSSLLPWNGVSSLLVLTTFCVCDIHLSDGVMSLNILFGCSQTINVWNVVTNFFNFSTTHITHLVACQTPHLIFFCSFSDRPPNESPAQLKVLTSVAVHSATMIAMDASMRALFWSVVISGIQSLSVTSSCLDIFHCPCQYLVAPMQSESRSNVAWLSRPSIFGTDTFLCKVFRLCLMLPEFGHLSNPELLSTILPTSDAFLKVS